MNGETLERIQQQLVANARKASTDHRAEIETWHPVRADGRDFIPGYIPYIGAEYLHPRTTGCRILAYALSQNFGENWEESRKWARDWREGDGMLALDRQNRYLPKSIMMHPFDTGHIPILASLLRSIVSGRLPKDLESVYPEIAATNLSKFSFRTDDKRKTIDNDNSLRQCWKWFSSAEVGVMRPTHIICCGERSFRIIHEGLPTLFPSPEAPPKVVRVAFPSLLVINGHYHRKRVPEGEHRGMEAEVKERVARSDWVRPVDHRLTVETVICRDVYYFWKMFQDMKTQLCV